MSRTPAGVDPRELAEVFGALANPTRLTILGWLREPDSFPPQEHPAREVGVCLKHIQNRAGVSQSTASQYMAVLQRAGLVTSRKIGPWRHYRRDEATLRRLARYLGDQL